MHIPNILTPEEIREARALLEQASWDDGKHSAGHRARTVKNNLQLPPDHPDAVRLGEMIASRLGQNPTYVSAVLPLRLLPPRFNRYEGEGHYGNHVDSAIFPVPGTSISVRSDVSTTVFLSDPDDYEGGELIIQDIFGERQIKLPAGDAIVYPCGRLHRVAPVTRGVRFGAFFWAQSLVPQDHRRDMLYELDQAVQGIAADHPEHGSVDKLTALYHNLLREWSST